MEVEWPFRFAMKLPVGTGYFRGSASHMDPRQSIRRCGGVSTSPVSTAHIQRR